MNMLDEATTTTCCRLGEQKRSGPRWQCCGAGSGSIGYRGRCIPIGRTFYKRQPTEEESACEEKRPRRSLGACAKRLEIEIIAASSPQAKGRVERAATGSIRIGWVKKLRRRGIEIRKRRMNTWKRNIFQNTIVVLHGKRLDRRTTSRKDAEHSEAERSLPVREGTMDQQRLGGAIPRAFSAAQKTAEQASYGPTRAKA